MNKIIGESLDGYGLPVLEQDDGEKLPTDLPDAPEPERLIPDDDEKRFVDEVFLVAANDGDAYKMGKDAKMAVDKAIDDHIKLKIRDLRDTADKYRDKIVAKLKHRWMAEDIDVQPLPDDSYFEL